MSAAAANVVFCHVAIDRGAVAFMRQTACCLALPFLCPPSSFGSGVGRSLLFIVSAVAVDFLALGCGVATLGWGLCNKALRRKAQHSHAVEQSVEW